MRIYKKYILSCFLLFNFVGFSQTNLVSNPGFENHTLCPTFMLQWDRCIGWLNCNGNVGNGLWGTPDYFHTCGTTSLPYNPVPPNTGNGFCNPHTGSAMMGLVCYNPPYPNYREYISRQLDCPMTPGNTYTVSFWITASSAPTVKYNSSHFGVYLSGIYPVQTTYQVMNYIPQYEITTVINNTTWQQHTFTLTPTSNLNYITLGCFKNESTVVGVLTTPSASQPYSNYFIDDIEVLSSVSSGTISTSSSVINAKCFGLANGSATLTATGSSNNYLWSPGNYTTASVNNLSAGIYTVTISDGACNTTTTSVTITQPSSLTSSLTSTSYSVCKNQSITLNSFVSGGTPSYSVNWNTGATNTSSIIVSPSVTSVYSYTVTDANLCTKIQTLSISVQNPIANFSVASTPCSGTATFTNVSTGSSNYNWTLGNGSISSTSNPGVQTYSSSGTYTIQLNTSSSLGCLDSIIKTVNITVPTTVAISQTASSILCFGGSSSATVNPVGVGPFTYSWSPLTNATSVANNLLAGNYTVNVSSPSCETGSLVINITQPSQLNTTLTATSYSVCKNQPVTLNSIVSGGTPSYSVNWNTGATNTSSVTISPSVTSVYSYTVTDANLCIKSQTLSISVQNPIANFSVASTPCSGTATFTNVSTGSSSYIWTFANGNTSSLSNPGAQTFTSSGIYTVQLNSSSSLGCLDSIVKTINISVPSTVSMSQTSSSISCYGGSSSATVNPVGVGPFTYTWSPLTNTTSVANNLLAGNYTVNVSSPSCETGSLVINISQPSQLNTTLTATSYSVCENSSTSLMAANIGGTPSYSVNWNTGETNTNSITITPTVTSIYTYTITDSNSCTKTQTVQINVESTLAGFINSTPACNSLISFTNTSTNYATCFWNFGDGQTSNSNTVTSNNYVSSGIYTVSLISSTINGCKDTIEQTVNINANFLNLDFDYSVKTSKCIDSLFFVNNSQGATSYVWNFGDGNTGSQISPSHTYSSGVFNVTLVGFNPNCLDSITKEIVINDSYNSSNVNTPNVFTPNGDGANDVFDFKVMSKCEDFIFEIFDRWGLSIFKMTDGKQTFWDGRTTSGKDVTDGTYFYIMITESDNKFKGTVTLFR